LGVSRRNPSLENCYLFLKESEQWSKEELLKYQLLKCKEFLIFVGEYSPYYNGLFKELSFNPHDLNSLDDLKIIPTMNKSVLLQNTEAIHTCYPFKKRFYSETSGTSGQPLRFYRNEEWDSYHRAAIYRGYSWFDVKPWERNGYFWGYNIEKWAVLKTRILDALQNRFRVFSYDKNEIVKFAKKLSKATYLHGYSSMIYEVAKIVNDQNIRSKYQLKMIKGTSEKIYDNYHVEVEKAFGLKIISEYGAAEAGIIAFECPEGNMHVTVENVVVEIENGEIVVTNLLSKSFPIIRYKLGDFITFAEPEFKCKCGRNHLVIKDVLGRVGKKIIGYKNEYPSLTFYYVFKNLALNKNIVLNYQAVQHEQGRVKLRIEQLKPDTEKYLQDELYKYFGRDIDFTISYGQILHSFEGKLMDFITTIN
jgi:phenylacetate-CoA ligase